jgi:hypothetical protein
LFFFCVFVHILLLMSPTCPSHKRCGDLWFRGTDARQWGGFMFS